VRRPFVRGPTMSADEERSALPADSAHLAERKRQVARRLRCICPDIQDEELAHVVDRIARIELQHDLAQLGIRYGNLDADLELGPR
jgi:hypothetical protein